MAPTPAENQPSPADQDPPIAVPEQLLARVQPQAWVNDYAVDTEPAVTFDAAPVLRAMTREDRNATLNALRTNNSDYVLDELYSAAAALGLVADGYGPFTVSSVADADDIDAWEHANPYVEPQRTPMDVTTSTPFAELQVGDVFLRTDEFLEVTVTAPAETMTVADIFGRTRHALLARLDTGVEGPFFFDAGDRANKAHVCGRHGGAWGNDLTCSDCTTEDGETRPLPVPAS